MDLQILSKVCLLTDSFVYFMINQIEIIIQKSCVLHSESDAGNFNIWQLNRISRGRACITELFIKFGLIAEFKYG